MGIFGSTLHGFLHFSRAFSRLSDSGEDAKVKGTRKVGGAGKRKKEGCSRFLNSADSTIWEPGSQATFSPVFLTESCSFSYGVKDLSTLQKLDEKVVLDHQKLMTSQAVEGTWQSRSQGSLSLWGKRENPGNELGMWIRTGGYGRYTGEWVKKENGKNWQISVC